MSAQETCTAKTNKIADQLKQLERILNSYKAETAKGEVSWGHVGDLGRIENELEELIACYTQA